MHHQSQEPTEPRAVEPFALDPMDTKIVCLGIFRYDEPDAEFAFVYSGGTDSNVSADAFRSRQDSEHYTLYYSFLNYGSRTSTVTVRRV